MHDLTDLLRQLSNEPYNAWFIRRKHQGDWYYMGSYDEVKNSVTWTKNQEHATTFNQESTAAQAAIQIGDHGGQLEIITEEVEDY